MTATILGLHHVTATVDDAQTDLNFGIDTLGLRLVKKTVNFDNPGVYHFYYGDEKGTPSTIWTTFPYRPRGIRAGIHGNGQVTTTSFSVPAGSLDVWKKRLRERGLTVSDVTPRFGEESVMVTDPSGLAIELIGTTHDTRTPWLAHGLDESAAVRGIHSVTMTIADAKPTLAFMSEWLGFTKSEEMDGRTRMSVGGTGPGKSIDILHDVNAQSAINGIGTVHHVAMAIGSDEEQVALREALIKQGIQVTPVMDRSYFRSIYFREPGGVLFEVATTAPGFDVDEPLAQLGVGLKLPPWEESKRATIEAALPPVHY